MTALPGRKLQQCLELSLDICALSIKLSLSAKSCLFFNFLLYSFIQFFVSEKDQNIKYKLKQKVKKSNHCMKSVQIQSFFWLQTKKFTFLTIILWSFSWPEYGKISSRKSSVFGQFYTVKNIWHS